MLTGQSAARIDPENIVGIWLFDESSGDVANDSSDNDSDGAINGATRVDGKFGKALEFDGVDDNVEVTNSPIKGLNDITISVWFKRAVAAAFITVIGHGEPHTPGNVEILVSPTIIRFESHPTAGDTNMIDYGVDTEDEWFHVAATIDNGINKTLFVNGQEVGTSQMVSTWTGQDTETLFGIIQARTRYWKGLIDEVAIFNVALTRADIKSIMTKGLKSVAAVSPAGKLTTTWASIKAQ